MPLLSFVVHWPDTTTMTEPMYLRRKPSRELAAEVAGPPEPGRARASRDPAHGDYATNVALRLRPRGSASPRELAAGARRRGAALPGRRARRGRRAGLRQPVARRRVVRRARWPRSSTPVTTTARGFAATTRARPGRDGLRQPDRPDHCRLGPERRDRRLGRPAARARRRRGRARVLLQRRRRADGTLSRVGRGGAARGGAAGGRLPRRLRRASSRELEGDPVPEMLEQIEATLERFRVHFDSWAMQSVLASGCRSTCPGSTPTRRTAPSGPVRRRTATRRIA